MAACSQPRSHVAGVFTDAGQLGMEIDAVKEQLQKRYTFCS